MFHRHAELREPRGDRLAMPEMARRRHVPQQLRPRQYPALEQPRLQHRHLLVRHQDVDTEIERALVAGVLGFGAADERASTDLAGDEAPASRLGVGARDRRHPDAEVTGQIAMRRQPRAGLHVPVDRVRNRPGRGAATSVELRKPHCHSRNISIAAFA